MEEEIEKEKEEISQLKQWPNTLAPSPQVAQAAWTKKISSFFTTSVLSHDHHKLKPRLLQPHLVTTIKDIPVLLHKLPSLLTCLRGLSNTSFQYKLQNRTTFITNCSTKHILSLQTALFNIKITNESVLSYFYT